MIDLWDLAQTANFTKKELESFRVRSRRCRPIHFPGWHQRCCLITAEPAHCLPGPLCTAQRDSQGTARPGTAWVIVLTGTVGADEVALVALAEMSHKEGRGLHAPGFGKGLAPPHQGET